MRATLPPELDELTEKVNRSAFAVARALGHGFLEAVYKNALVVELGRVGIQVEKERVFPVHYRGEKVGNYVADLVVGNSVVVELKVVEALSAPHSAQLLNYLKASQLPVGLLFNFGKPRIDVRRVLL
jgi:GxxExxY protein